MRVGACDGAAFSALLTHLTVGCTPQQLASDAAFLQQELRAAERQRRHVRAFLLRRMGDVVAAIAGPLLGQQQPGGQQGANCAPSPRDGEELNLEVGGDDGGLLRSAETPRSRAASRQQSVGRTEAVGGGGGAAPAGAAVDGGELLRAVAVLAGGGAAASEARVGAVEALCTALSGSAAEQAAQVGKLEVSDSKRHAS